MESVIQKIENKWKRRLVMYAKPNIYCVYVDEIVLTGFVVLLLEPQIVDFNESKCVGVNLSDWVMAKYLAAETVTPFRIVAQGKGLIEKAFMPHTGLKYAVRGVGVEGTPVVHIPVADFNSV